MFYDVKVYFSKKHHLEKEYLFSRREMTAEDVVSLFKILKEIGSKLDLYFSFIVD